MKQEPGSKVLIIEDCREGSPATGQVGVYEGQFPRGAAVWLEDGAKELYYDSFISKQTRFTSGDYAGTALVDVIPLWSPNGQEPHPLGDNYPVVTDSNPEPPYWFPTDNPRIRLQDGSVIWGDECWWGDAETASPLEQAQESLEQHKNILRELAGRLSENAPE